MTPIERQLKADMLRCAESHRKERRWFTLVYTSFTTLQCSGSTILLAYGVINLMYFPVIASLIWCVVIQSVKEDIQSTKKTILDSWLKERDDYAHALEAVRKK